MYRYRYIYMGIYMDVDIDVDIDRPNRSNIQNRSSTSNRQNRDIMNRDPKNRDIMNRDNMNRYIPISSSISSSSMNIRVDSIPGNHKITIEAFRTEQIYFRQNRQNRDIMKIRRETDEDD